MLGAGRKCVRCNRLRAACICASVQRRHERENRREPKSKQYIANPGNRKHQWCSCGALIRNGQCVSATCGKSA